MNVYEWAEQHELQRPECYSAVGDGWRTLLDDLVRDLKALGWTGKLAQVKEKFGGLRFYIEDGTAAINDRIRAAEAASYCICEDCGAPGTLMIQGWRKVACAAHAAPEATNATGNLE